MTGYQPQPDLVDLLDQVITRGRQDASRLVDVIEAAVELRSFAIDVAPRTDTTIATVDHLLLHARNEQERAHMSALANRLNPTTERITTS